MAAAVKAEPAMPHASRKAAVALALILAACLAGDWSPASAEDAKAMAGDWELSNAKRDRLCTVALREAAAGPGTALVPEARCAGLFPFLRDVAAWKANPPFALQFLNAAGTTVIEFTNVEDSLYEGERPAEGILFMQNVAGGTDERTAEQMAGNWTLTAPRGRQGCRFVLAAAPASSGGFTLTPGGGCDAAIVKFAPVAWRLDRGELQIISRNGATWRFEEAEPGTWQRIPADGQPLQLIRE